MLNTVKVPKEFEPLFEKAQEYADKYFKEKKEDPTKGTIEVFGQRYILIRAAAMSVEFFEMVRDLYKEAGEAEANEIARSFLFDLAHAIGKADARNFHEKMGLKDPIAKLSAGPVHFAYTGWAFVDIFPESKPTPDENYYLIYDHPYSFESDAWLRAGEKSDFPVCIMNAGYSSGWCEESFGIPLVAVELLCVAKKDQACRFIMAHPSRIEGYIKEYLAKNPQYAKTNYEVPGFFSRKRKEEERRREENILRESEERYKALFSEALDGICLADVETGLILDCNEALAALVGRAKSELIGQPQKILHPPAAGQAAFSPTFKQHLGEKEGQLLETQVVTKSGEIKEVEIKANILQLRGQKMLQGIFRDITDRKRMEKSLKESEQMYRNVVENANETILVAQDGQFKFVNKKVIDLLGYSPNELLGKNFTDYIYPDDRKMVVERHLKRLKGEDLPGIYPFRVIDKTGRTKWVEINAVVVQWQNKPATLNFLADITERTRAEEQIRDKVLELQQIADAAMGRENKMMKVEKEVDSLLKELGRTPKYE